MIDYLISPHTELCSTHRISKGVLETTSEDDPNSRGGWERVLDLVPMERDRTGRSSLSSPVNSESLGVSSENMDDDCVNLCSDHLCSMWIE